MRRILLLALLAWPVAPLLRSAEYAVSLRGDDRSNGSVATPWRTFAHAIAHLGPGDRLTIAGGRWAESLVVPRLGTSEHPIVITAAVDAVVVIDGADVLPRWTDLGHGLWEAPVADGAESGDGMLLDGDKPLPEACWPEGTIDPLAPVYASATVAADRAVVPDLPPGNWQGGLVLGFAGPGWGAQAGRITAASTNHLTLTPAAEGAWFTGSARIRIIGGAAPITPGTWRVQAGRLSIRLPAVARPEALRWVVRPLGIDLGGARHVVVSGLRLVGCTIVAYDAEDCTISDCHVTWPDRSWLVQPYSQEGGVRIAGARNRLLRCTVDGGTGNGISVEGRDHLIAGCTVRGVNAAGTYAAGLLVGGDGHRILACTIGRCGRDGIHLRHDAAGHRVIDRVEVSEVGLLADDCGALYAWNQDGAGTTITRSWFHGNRAATAGPLIYFDDGSRGFTVSRVVAWDSRCGDAAVRLNGGVAEVRLAHITSFACAPVGARTYIEDGRPPPRYQSVNLAHLVDVGQALVDPGHGIFAPRSGDTSLVDHGTSSAWSAPVIGAAPDLGAYEVGGEDWRPGAMALVPADLQR